jgi:hypothetical protein
MRLAKMILAGSMLTVISSAALAQSSVALAQATQPTQETAPPPGTQKGLVTVVNRLSNTIAIEPTQSDSKEASGGRSSNQFKIDHKLSETVHAGDKVKFSVSDSGDPKTITKIETE